MDCARIIALLPSNRPVFLAEKAKVDEKRL
jgi:hypothetical protein